MRKITINPKRLKLVSDSLGFELEKGRDENVSPDTSTVDRRPLRFSWSTSTTEVFYLVDVDQTEVFYLVDVVDVNRQCL